MIWFLGVALFALCAVLAAVCAPLEIGRIEWEARTGWKGGPR